VHASTDEFADDLNSEFFGAAMVIQNSHSTNSVNCITNTSKFLVNDKTSSLHSSAHVCWLAGDPKQDSAKATSGHNLLGTEEAQDSALSVQVSVASENAWADVLG